MASQPDKPHGEDVRDARASSFLEALGSVRHWLVSNLMSSPLPEEKMAALTELIFRGRKIEAIKVYRDLTGVGLKEAKEAVESLESSLRETAPEKFSAPQARGCSSATAVLGVGLLAVGYALFRLTAV